MKTIAFIFARGGSKGLVNKNIKLLGELPLIVHTINLAKKIKKIDDVYVSTDSQAIKKISLDYGANVIDRPDGLATDKSPELLSWKHAIKYLRNDNINFDCFLSLPTTSPLRNEEDVIACLDAVKNGNNFVITVTPAARNPYFNMVTRDSKGNCNIVNEGKFYRRQDAPEVYDVTTVAYAARPEKILDTEALFSEELFSVVVPKERAVDIDDEIDFLIAEKLFITNGKT